MKVKVGDKLVEGEDVDFTPREEPWTYYDLGDGTVLRVRTIVAKVIRTEEYSEEGEPLYAVKSKTVVGTDVPDELWKAADDDGS